METGSGWKAISHTDARSVDNRRAGDTTDSTTSSNSDSVANVPIQIETVFGVGYTTFMGAGYRSLASRIGLPVESDCLHLTNQV